MTPDIQPSEPLIARLKRIHDSAEATTAKLRAESEIVSKDFSSLARIALTHARIECRIANDTERLEVIKQTVLIPDEDIPNAHNNEVCLTNFVKSELPKEKWPMFLDPEEPTDTTD